MPNPLVSKPPPDPAFVMDPIMRAYRAALAAEGRGHNYEQASWRATPARSASLLREHGLRAARKRGEMFAHRFGFGVPFVPVNEPVPLFLLPALRLVSPLPLVVG